MKKLLQFVKVKNGAPDGSFDGFALIFISGMIGRPM